MKRRYHALGLVAGLIVAIAFALYVARSLHDRDLSVYATPHAFIGIGAAAIFYSLSLLLTAWAWRGLLHGMRVHKSWRELIAILAITQFAKYLPGNVGQYVGRAAMSLARGINARAFAVTIVLEMLLMMSAGICIGLGMGLLSSVGLTLIPADKGHLLILVIILLVGAISGLLLVRKAVPPLLRHFAPQHAHVLDSGLLPPKATIARTLLIYCAAYCVIGAGFDILTHLLLPASAHNFWLLTASFALAWVVGFVTPGAPAGLGVREGLLLLMLAPVYSPALAGILIIALRLATTLADVLSFVVGLFLLPRPTRHFTTVHSSEQR